MAARTIVPDPKDFCLYLRDVQKSYDSKVVLEDIDFAIQKGEFCTMVGPSGCGKSTLFRLILGQERPTAGALYMSGKPIGYPDTSRGIVYQQYSLYPHLTVLQNVLLGRKLTHGFWKYRSQKRQFEREGPECLKRMRLSENDFGKYPHELSGGMQQRVAIAQAFIMRPQVLLMDEPFGALDPGTRATLQLFMLELWEETGMTILFVTHDLEEAVFLGTRVLVLSQYHDAADEGYTTGARIKADHVLPRKAHASGIKETAEFGQLIERIRGEAASPTYHAYVREFNLTHDDSFQTL